MATFPTYLLPALLGLAALAPARAQTTAWVLLQPDSTGVDYRSPTTWEKQLIPKEVPKQLRRYLIKSFVLGGQPGQPPAQTLYFLIGRTADGTIGVVPAVPGTLRFRKQDMQLYSAAKPTAEGKPRFFQLRMSGVPALFPIVYPSGGFSYYDSQEQELFLMIGEINARKGSLPVGSASLPLSVERFRGLKSAPNYLPDNTVFGIPDGQHDRQRYYIGDAFAANGYVGTFQAVSPDGDSLRVQLTTANAAPLTYGNYSGLAFRAATLTDLDGRSLVLTGTERPLILDFWGTWCGPCVALTPRLKQLHERYATRADLVSVALDESTKVRSYLQANNISWCNVAISEQQVATSLIRQLRVDNYPTFILVYRGKILSRGIGEKGLNELEQQLATLPQ